MPRRARSEHDCVGDIKRCQHRTDTGVAAGGQNVERQLRASVPATHGSYDLTHVTRNAGDSEQAGFRGRIFRIQRFVESLAVRIPKD